MVKSRMMLASRSSFAHIEPSPHPNYNKLAAVWRGIVRTTWRSVFFLILLAFFALHRMRKTMLLRSNLSTWYGRKGGGVVVDGCNGASDERKEIERAPRHDGILLERTNALFMVFEF
jgi:hypothetical protein